MGENLKSPQGTAEVQLTITGMSHRYESILIHCVFSTKERRPIIPEALTNKLWAYIGGIARTNQFKALAVGGMSDHAHALLSIPAPLAISKAVQLIKGGSSKWINDHARSRSFAWQDSYGVFSIGISQVDETVRYIKTQEKHHAKMSFKEEFRRFLENMGFRNTKTELHSSPAGTSSATTPFPPLKRRAILSRPLRGLGLVGR